jgi:prepilin-type N-terminal cleavage/methylation domain-containing protein
MKNAAQTPPRAGSSRSSGFTIIETLIVLAIAGLILLIIFQAIPALTRSSRNNQRKQDVAIILSAVSRYELNDSGNFPSPCGNGAQPPCTQSGGGPNPNDYFLQFAGGKLTYYPGSGVSSNPQTSVSRFNQAGPNDIGKVQIYNYEKCSNTPGTATIAGAGYSDIVALYDLESGNGGMTPQCQQL